MSNQDPILETIVAKIDAGTVTTSDFDALIRESTPEAVRNRVRRRTKRTPTERHVDIAGHQQLQLPTFKDRIAPKRKPGHQQSHGRGRLGHDHSTRTQRRIGEALQFIATHIGKPIDEAAVKTFPDQRLLRVLTTKLLLKPGIDRDWLMNVKSLLEIGHG